MLDWDSSCRDEVIFCYLVWSAIRKVAFQSIIYHNITYKYNTGMLFYKGIKVFVADKVQHPGILYLSIKLFSHIKYISPEHYKI